jgi:hypothetical protein
MKITFEKTYESLPEFVLRALEQVWHFNLPKTYREFLLSYNGGIPENNLVFDYVDDNNTLGSNLRYLFGITPEDNLNVLRYIETYENRIPKTMFPIATDDFGNLILIGVKNPYRGKVYFWDHEMEADEEEQPYYENIFLISSSFEEFIEGLKEEEDE